MQDKKTPSPPTTDTLKFEIGEYDSLCEKIVKPDRALYLPAYFARWVKHLGPELAWMYASFRQAAYMDGGRNGETTTRITVTEIAARAGIARRTYQIRAANPDTWKKLHGLVSRMDESRVWKSSPDRPKQLPSSFVVAMTLPLTPVDTASLSTWLLENLDRFGSVESVLRAAAETPQGELIPVNAEVTTDPQTVRALVFRLFGEQLDAKLLDALASAIQNHIMPSNDQIKITVFFMEHILPYLGTGPGWVVTLLRDKCFDGETETRNRVVVKGGYAEIASWLGISRVKTVWEWLNMRKAGKYINPVLNLYLREIVDERDYEKCERTFKVLLEETPSELLETFATGQGLMADLLAKGADFDQVMAGMGGDESFGLGLAEFTPMDGGLLSQSLMEFSSHLGGFCIPALADFAPHFGGSCAPALAQIAPHPGANCAVKSSLTPTPNSLNPPNQPGEEASMPELMSGRAGWLFSEIAKNNALNPKGRQRLRRLFADEQVLSQKFLAWILYAFSPQGKGLNDTTGISMAVRSLNAEPPEFAPRKFEILAKLGPQKLQELFDRDYARMELGDSLEAKIHADNFRRLDAERKSDLYFRLFGKENPKPAAKPKTAERPKTFLELQKEKVRAEREASQKANIQQSDPTENHS